MVEREIPPDTPAWLARWIGGMEMWQKSVDSKLDKALELLESNHSSEKKKMNSPQPVTFKWLTEKALMPLLLGINTILLGLIIAHLLQGG